MGWLLALYLYGAGGFVVAHCFCTDKNETPYRTAFWVCFLSWPVGTALVLAALVGDRLGLATGRRLDRWAKRTARR